MYRSHVEKLIWKFSNSCVIERGLSNFYNMTMKIHFQKQKPNIINYHDYINFSEREYRQQISYQFSVLGNVWEEVSFESFLGISKDTRDKTASIKQKYVNSNYSPFLNKNILKAIMNRTRLRNKLWKSRSIDDKVGYKNQRNSCLPLNRKA